MPVHRKLFWFTTVAALFLVAATGCERPSDAGPTSVKTTQTATHSAAPSSEPPNILWIVWDTVRADKLGVYGYPSPTTPYLDEWAKSARVYEDVVSPAPITLSTHGSWFTGLLPSEHGVDNRAHNLCTEHTTLAELLQQAGYRTYLFSENPHICAANYFSQGFDDVEHPWSDRFRERAIEIARQKVEAEHPSSDVARKVSNNKFRAWTIKSAGELTEDAVQQWLARSPAGKPYFVFLNYMEAHRPLLPPRKYRERLMSSKEVVASYAINKPWAELWAHTFGVGDIHRSELKIVRKTYDAAIAELDDLFKSLIERLDAAGQLDNTVIILTSDHGELLGEHHMLDHQFAVYEELLRVPLIVRFPARFEAGRDARTVTTLDLFPTVLELAGVEQPANLQTRAVSLLGDEVETDRVRLAQYLSPLLSAFDSVRKRQARQGEPFDATPWMRSLNAHYEGPQKLIVSSNGAHELYDLSLDKREKTNLYSTDDSMSRDLLARARALIAALQPPPCVEGGVQPPPLSPDDEGRLKALGYAAGGDDGNAQDEDD